MAQKPAQPCEICSSPNSFLEKAHIVSESGKSNENIINICPNCHKHFDNVLKRRLYIGLTAYGVKGLPKSWEIPQFDKNKKHLFNAMTISKLKPGLSYQQFTSELRKMGIPMAEIAKHWHKYKIK